MNKTTGAVPSILHTTTGAGPFEVVSVTTIDRPWARSASYPTVPAGTRIVTIHRFKRQGAAVRRYEEILAGADDCAGEYVTKVTVYQDHPNHARLRIVRRTAPRPASSVVVQPGRVTVDRYLAITAIAAAADRAHTPTITRRVCRMAVDWSTDLFTTLAGELAALEPAPMAAAA